MQLVGDEAELAQGNMEIKMPCVQGALTSAYILSRCHHVGSASHSLHHLVRVFHQVQPA